MGGGVTGASVGGGVTGASVGGGVGATGGGVTGGGVGATGGGVTGGGVGDGVAPHVILQSAASFKQGVPPGFSQGP